MYQAITTFNFVIFALFLLCNSYQAFYVAVPLFRRRRKNDNPALHRYAVVISARNEQAVIGELLDSLAAQSYPDECYDVYVVADNCTDETARIAREHGAIVMERFNSRLVGKGYSLDYAFKAIERERGLRAYEGYFVFDADNVLDENYLAEMNRTFDLGYRVVTSYRNSKNYDSNWISAGYALWFLRESKYLNGSRMLLGTGCAISGTGFLVSSDIIARDGGWKYHLLTEDIEFSVANAIEGEVIGYCDSAVLYDEQPIRFRDSWNQRLRWTKGFYQVFRRYGARLARGVFGRRGFQCYDMLMTIAPATILPLVTVVCNSAVFLYGLQSGRTLLAELCLAQVFGAIFGVYLSLFLFGLVTTITEWRQIHCVWYRKILYLFTFPIFILTYVPIAMVALFKKVTWKPIAHTVIKSVQEIRQ